MSIKCSEVVNFNLSMSYYRLISQIMEEEVKYIRGYKSLINEDFKKSLNFQVTSGSKLANLPDDFEFPCIAKRFFPAIQIIRVFENDFFPRASCQIFPILKNDNFR